MGNSKPLMYTLAALCVLLTCAVIVLSLLLVAGSDVLPPQVETEAPVTSDEPDDHGEIDEPDTREVLRYLLTYPLDRYILLRDIDRSIRNARQAAYRMGIYAHHLEHNPAVGREEVIFQNSRARVIAHFERYRESLASDPFITPQDREEKLSAVDDLELRLLNYFDVYIAAIFAAASEGDTAEVLRLMQDSTLFRTETETETLERLSVFTRVNLESIYAIYAPFAN